MNISANLSAPKRLSMKPRRRLRKRGEIIERYASVRRMTPFILSAFTFWANLQTKGVSLSFMLDAQDKSIREESASVSLTANGSSI